MSGKINEKCLETVRKHIKMERWVVNDKDMKVFVNIVRNNNKEKNQRF